MTHKLCKIKMCFELEIACTILRKSYKSVALNCLTEARSSNVPSHISHLLGTYGPAVGVDADTNSSLVAVDIAVRDLQRGAVHYAIVAGE